MKFESRDSKSRDSKLFAELAKYKITLENSLLKIKQLEFELKCKTLEYEGLKHYIELIDAPQLDSKELIEVLEELFNSREHPSKVSISACEQIIRMAHQENGSRKFEEHLYEFLSDYAELENLELPFELPTAEFV